jgi:1,4-alpha-glucan branching enzyme
MNCDEVNKCLIYERAGLIFLFNFHPTGSIPGYEFTVPEPGKYKLLLNTDSSSFGGHGRIDEKIIYASHHDEQSKTNRVSIYFTCRTAIVLGRIK